MMLTENSVYFNPAVKEHFLDQYDNEKSKKVYSFPLKKAKDYEEQIGKDIYEMNLAELSDLLYAMKPSSLNAAYHNYLRISEYLDFAAEHGYSKSNISQFSVVTNPMNFNKKFVATYQNVYYTRKQLFEDMIDDLVNDVDGALLLALFEGISGKGYGEILNLKKEDIMRHIGTHDEYYTVDLIDGDKKRTIQISEELAELLIKADSEADYVSNNGRDGIEGRYLVDYEPSEFIFKRANRGAIKDEKLNHFWVQRKFSNFKEFFDNEYFKPKNIRDSGMMAMAHQLYQERGHFGREELMEIGEQFDVFKINEKDGKVLRNVTKLREVVTRDAFEELYGYKLPLV